MVYDDKNGQNIKFSNRINKHKADINALYPILKGTNITTKAKTIIFTTVLRPALLYGSETWTVTSISSKIQAPETRVLRMIQGVTRLGRIRNEVTRERFRVTSVQ